nr:MAG TPA: hypothetical protein [Caudoviricetes sp.]
MHNEQYAQKQLSNFLHHPGLTLLCLWTSNRLGGMIE